jgi:Tfp pilus assembly ATPase PilU
MSVALSIGCIFLMLGLFSIWRDSKERKQDIVLRAVETSDRIPSISPRTKAEVYRGDILDELAKTELHIMFGVMSGAGKSTSMKAIIYN